MLSKQAFLISASAVLLLAGSDQPWKDVKAAEWSDEDAKVILTESPWAKKVTPILNNDVSQYPMGRRGGMGNGGGMGYPRRGGMGYPGGGYPGGGYPGGGYPGGGGGGYPGGGNGGGNYPNGNGGQRNPNDQSDDEDANRRRNSNEPKEVTLRWESAEPIQQALLKAKDSLAPSMNPKEYAIVVTGLPRRLRGSGNSNSNVYDEKALKGKAYLKKDSNKKIKATNVKIIKLEDSVTVVFFFSRKDEITLKDRLIEFDAKIGRYEIDRPFVLSEMMYDGRLSL